MSGIFSYQCVGCLWAWRSWLSEKAGGRGTACRLVSWGVAGHWELSTDLHAARCSSSGRRPRVTVRKWAVITAVQEGNMFSRRDETPQTPAQTDTHCPPAPPPPPLPHTDNEHLMISDVITRNTQLPATGWIPSSSSSSLICPEEPAANEAAGPRCSAPLMLTSE